MPIQPESGNRASSAYQAHPKSEKQAARNGDTSGAQHRGRRVFNTPSVTLAVGNIRSATPFESKRVGERRIDLNSQTSLQDKIQFQKFWKESDALGPMGDTVGHVIMTPRPAAEERGVSGIWHVKKPGQISRLEKTKRFFVSLVYRLTGSKTKALYYRNTQLLVEKEVLAGKLNRLVMLSGNTYCSGNWGLAEQMHHGYSYDDEQDEHCVANQHIEHSHLASKEFGNDLTYDGENNPASAYVMRRFFLGDADSLKRGNYLVQVDKEHSKRSFVSIDFGMAFHDHWTVPDNIDFSDFVEKVLTPPLAYQAHYSVLKRGEGIHDLFKGMSINDRECSVYMSLQKIAGLSHQKLEEMTQQITDVKERNRILEELTERVDLSKKLCREAENRPAIRAMLKRGGYKDE